MRSPALSGSLPPPFLDRWGAFVHPLTCGKPLENWYFECLEMEVWEHDFRFQLGEFKFPWAVPRFGQEKRCNPLSFTFLDGLQDISQPQLALDPILVKLRDCGHACFWKEDHPGMHWISWYHSASICFCHLPVGDGLSPSSTVSSQYSWMLASEHNSCNQQHIDVQNLTLLTGWSYTYMIHDATI